MSPRPDNVDISDGFFSRRIALLRERAHLTKSELAARAQVSYRTVHDLEIGRRTRIQEKTLNLLAEALGVDPHELLDAPLTAEGVSRSGPTSVLESGGDDTRPQDSGEEAGESSGTAIPQVPTPGDSGRHQRDGRAPASGRSGPLRTVRSIVTPGLAVLVVASGALVWQVGLTRADWTLDRGVLVARHGILGVELWRLGGRDQVRSVQLAPWSDQVLLVGLTDGSERPLLALERRSGKRLWSVVPDREEIAAAFGTEDVNAGTMQYLDHQSCDLDGDREPEIVARFTHSIYYPCALCWVAPDGRILGQYTNRGHFLDVLVADLDGDGKDEVLAGGTNNALAYQGATLVLLDNTHFRGAATDAMATPTSTVPDSCLVRLLLPALEPPYMDLLGTIRLHAKSLSRIVEQNGSYTLSCMVGQYRDLSRAFLVFVDAELNPLRADITDALLTETRTSWPDSLRETGPADPEWRQRWLDTAIRFESGHWPPLEPGARHAAR